MSQLLVVQKMHVDSIKITSDYNPVRLKSRLPIYSSGLQSYIVVSSFKDHCRPTTIENSIRFCCKLFLHYYRAAIFPVTDVPGASIVKVTEHWSNRRK